jgi:hypothetical protein
MPAINDISLYLNLFYTYEIKYTWNIIISFLITLLKGIPNING